MAVCKECNTCGVKLTLNVNWLKSQAKQKKYWCNTCKKADNDKRMYVNGRHISRNHPLYKPGRYKTFNDAAFAGTYKLDSIKEGYVYVITNKAWPDWVKIGMAIDAEDRCNGYQTSSPHRDYVLEHSVYSNDRRKSEQQAHTRATKIALETNGEWFKLTVQQAIEVLNNLDEHRLGTAEEANTDTPKDKLQERSVQEDLWTYTQNRKTA
jgi:hypothetical protein